MWRRALITLLVAATLPAAAPAAAQQPCPGLHCVMLPAVHLPVPVRPAGSEVWYRMVGVVPIAALYAKLANATAAPLCDVVIAYRVDNPAIEDVTGTAQIEVIMPDEVEWRWLTDTVQTGYALDATARSWRSSGCNYVRLTPVEQRVTPVDFATLTVEGSVRNDTGVTVRAPRIRLSPGHNFSHHYDFTLEGRALEPGATATYSRTMQLYYHGGKVTEFRVSAIGQGE